MELEHHPLVKDLPEHHDTIHRLKTENAHFRQLFDEYHELDREIYRHEQDIEPTSDDYLEDLKMRRVHLKDELYAMVKKAGAQTS
jgi:uncharacterized protein YdcH (DUF465 family)